MARTNNEIHSIVDRYKGEKDIHLNSSDTALLDLFAEWLLQQNFCKPDVSGWQEFETIPPNEGDTVLVKNKKTGRLQVWEIKHETFTDDYLKAYCWTYPPA